MFYRYHFVKITILTFTFILSSSLVRGQNTTADLVWDVQVNGGILYHNINSLSFSGKVKVFSYLGHNFLNITTIPYLEEYFFEGFWIKPDSIRISVKAHRSYKAELFSNDTSVFKSKYYDVETGRGLLGKFPLPDPMRYTYDESLVESKVSERLRAHGIENTWPVFPFAAGADSLYNYKKTGEITVNGRKVIELSVSPKYSDIPGVIGIFRIDDAEKHIVNSRYRFNESAKIKDADLADLRKQNKFMGSLISIDEDFIVESNKGLFHSVYWLPIESREDIFMTFWGIKGRICRHIEYQSYEINPDLTLLLNIKNIDFQIDSSFEASVFEDSGELIELSNDEETEIVFDSENYFKSADMNVELFDSDNISQNANELIFDRYSNMTALKISKRLTEYAGYNRVEGFRLNLSASVHNPIIDNSILCFGAGYGFSDKKYKGELSFIRYIDDSRSFIFEGRLFDGITYEENEIKYSRLKNTISCLILKEDYRDYYYSQGVSVGFGLLFRRNLALKFTGIISKESQAEKKSDFAIMNWNEDFRMNPEIIRGEFRGFRGLLVYENPHSSVKLTGEVTDRSSFKSDFTYKYLRGDLNLSFDPSSNTRLNLNVAAGISSGKLPPQKWFDIGGKSFLDPYGNLRGVGYKAFTGDRIFKTVLELEFFERYRFDPSEEFSDWNVFKRCIKITPWIGVGWSDLSKENLTAVENINVPKFTAEDVYTELGIGIGDRFNVVRIDIIRNNMSENTVLLRFNCLR